MPDVVLAALVIAGVIIGYGGFAVAVGRFCGMNDRDELRIGARISDRALRLGDRQAEIARDRHYADMDAMARARARGDANVVELRPRPASPRGGFAA